jgi:hypothetical protein
VSLLTELDAFFTDHDRCGDLDAGVDGAIVWIVCECGASEGTEFAATLHKSTLLDTERDPGGQ